MEVNCLSRFLCVLLRLFYAYLILYMFDTSYSHEDDAKLQSFDRQWQCDSAEYCRC